jgi:predicted CXXCH cytochrome family protein
MEPMPTGDNGELCGDCHQETYFEWQASYHRDMELACSGCHDPHQTTLKEEDPATLCASCHRERSTNFTHTAHSQEGLNCADCHMTELTINGQEGHSKRDHSFFVSLESCNGCHVYEMHDPVDVHTNQQVAERPVDAMAAVEALPVTAEPVPVSPIGFTLLAGLVGIAFGIIIAPAFERMRQK